MEFDSVTVTKRISIPLIGIAFLVINSLIIYLIFNTDFFNTMDKDIWSIKFLLFTNGFGFGTFLIVLHFLKGLKLRDLFIIGVFFQIALYFFLTYYNHAVERDFDLYIAMAQNILDGKLFTPYTGPLDDWWRMVWPPFWMYWHTYHYWIYGHALDIAGNIALYQDIWRFTSVLVGIAITYAMIKIYEVKSSAEGSLNNSESFKIGLTFYIFSIFPVLGIILMTNVVGFAVLLGLLGFFFYFKSKTNSKYLYYSIFFFSLCALTELFAAIWILGILLVLLFQKRFKLFLILTCEVVGIFCLVCLPFLINDTVGFMQRLFWARELFAANWDGTIWTNQDPILNNIPTLLAIVYCIIYCYQNYKKEISLGFFLTIISFFLFFSPWFSPWSFLWILPLICINIESFRKFLITNLFFIGYFLVFFLILAVGLLWFATPDGSSLDVYYEVWAYIMYSLDWYVLLKLLGHTLFQLGLMYLIFSQTKSKRWILALLIPLVLYQSLYIALFNTDIWIY